MARKSAKPLTRLSEILEFCRDNRTPIAILGATPFGCLGLEGYMGSLHFVSALDCVSGMGRNAFAPEHQRQAVFHTALETCQDLLRHSEVMAHIKARGAGLLWPSDADETVTTLAKDLGATLAMAPVALRQAISNDSSCRVLLGKSGVTFVPKVSITVTMASDISDAAAKWKLGTHLVLEYRDDTGTEQVRFVERESDIQALFETLSGKTVGIAKFIAHQSVVIECVVTDAGIFTGPPLALYRGTGWRGACASAALAEAFRSSVTAAAKKIGSAIAERGFKGVFTATFYVEHGTGKIFLRRITPALTPYSQLINMLTSCYGGLPLHLLHLLTFLGVATDLDANTIAKRWAEHDEWSMVIPVQQGSSMEFITKSPASSIYRLTESGSSELVAPSINPLDVQGKGECLFLRTLGTGTYRQGGLELGLLMLRGNAFSDGRAVKWVDSLMAQTSTVQMSGTSLPQRGDDIKRTSLF